MDMQENRDEKWIAYLLGDLDPADAALVEEEMKANPEQALEVRETVERIRAWSSESVEHVPLNMTDLGIAQASELPEGSSRDNPRSRIPSFWVRAGALFAASAVLVAMTQARFSVSVGDNTFSWGMDKNRDIAENPDRPALEVTPIGLISRIEVLEQAATEMGDAVQALALQDSMMAESFKQNTLELAHYQRLESQARLSDMKRMMTWTDYPESFDAILASSAGAPEIMRDSLEHR